MTATAANLKQQAHQLIDHLPDTATWDDVVYAAELRASIDRGLEQSNAGQTLPHEDILKEFGIAE